MPIEGIEDDQVRKKVDSLLEKASGDDEYYRKWYAILTKLCYIFAAITLLSVVIIFLFKDSLFNLKDNHVFPQNFLILIIPFAIGSITSLLWRIRWKFGITKGWSAWRHRDEYFEASKVIRDYELTSGKKVTMKLPIWLYLFAVGSIGIVVILGFFCFQSTHPDDYFGFLGGLILSTVLIGGVLLNYMWPFHLKWRLIQRGEMVVNQDNYNFTKCRSRWAHYSLILPFLILISISAIEFLVWQLNNGEGRLAEWSLIGFYLASVSVVIWIAIIIFVWFKYRNFKITS